MPVSHYEEISREVCNNLISLDIFKESQIVSLYAPFNNEVNVFNVFNIKNKCFVFPKVLKKTKKLSFYKVQSFEDFKTGAYGILEPTDSLQKVELEEIDAFVVPGVAFSEKGERIGYGGGYYDSTLPFISKHAVTIGIAFDFQIIPCGFSNRNDIPVDIVITEKNIFNHKFFEQEKKWKLHQ